ncbi:MAG: DUF5711 family protein [Lachnospirales bacterium]
MKYLKYLAILLGVAITGSIIYFLYINNFFMSNEIQIEEVADGVYLEETFESTLAPEVIYATENSYYLLTTDGISVKNIKSELLWQNTFSLSEIYYAKSKNYIAVTEKNINNSNIYVYNTDGPVYTIKSSGSPNAYITINDNGYLCTILNNSDSYTVNVYNNLGEIIFTYVFEDTTIIPISTAIANNNKTLVINELDTSKIYPSPLFVYFDITTPNNNSIYGIKTYNNEKEYFLMLEYLDDTTLCAISNKYIYFISTLNNSTEVTSSIELTNKIKYATKCGTNIVVVYDEPLSNLSTIAKNTVQIINTKGEQISIPQINNVTLLEEGSNGFMIGFDNTYEYYTLTGSKMWEHFSDFEVKSSVPLVQGKIAIFSGYGKITTGKFSN